MRQITLTHGKWTVEVTPGTGGAISRCVYDGQDMLRPTPAANAASDDARDMACFPLVPFSNRIENGRFSFGGRDVHLPPNMGDHPHALHGQGWRGAWEVIEDGAEGRIVIGYEHAADSWPWPYRARQTFAPGGDSLDVVLAVTNLSDAPMPAGLGLHPYFPASEGVTLTAGISHMWDCPHQQIPVRLVPVPQELDFSRGIRIADVDLDHCFAGWSGRAVIEWPGRRYRLAMLGSPTLTHLVVYTPKGADFFCVEGVDNMNNAVNWLDRGVETGLHILEPGSTHEVTTTFRAEPASA
jgi:aldose 1-epimerase